VAASESVNAPLGITVVAEVAAVSSAPVVAVARATPSGEVTCTSNESSGSTRLSTLFSSVRVEVRMPKASASRSPAEFMKSVPEIEVADGAARMVPKALVVPAFAGLHTAACVPSPASGIVHPPPEVIGVVLSIIVSG